MNIWTVENHVFEVGGFCSEFYFAMSSFEGCQSTLPFNYSMNELSA